MNKKSNKISISIVFAYIGLILCILTIILTIYAYMTKDDRNIDKPIDNPVSENLKIIYNETSNVTMVNGNIGQKIIKTFNVENISKETLYYNISLKDIVNNFENKDDLVFTLKNDANGAYVKETVVPSNEEATISSNIKINENEKHNYIMTITFLKTKEDQTNNLNKTFSSNINIYETKYVKEENSLLDKIISLSNGISEDKLNFNDKNITNGIYYTNSSINGAKVYFYRGNNSLDNNVVFANKCWKIVRTTEDNGVRIIYNGNVNPDGSCQNIVDETAFIDNKTKYNQNKNYNAYVGFMYGTPSSKTHAMEHDNITSSTIKSELDAWYSINLHPYSNYIKDSIYCSNRKTMKFTYKNIVYGINGYGKSNTGYQTKAKNITKTNPNYNCENINDRFTVTNNLGNMKLNNPIGLITADELFYAGYINSIEVNDNFLYNNYPYWTMTPAYFNGSYAYNYIVNKGVLSSKTVDTQLGVRPVITLNENAKILSGDGSLQSPYKITE